MSHLRPIRTPRRRLPLNSRRLCRCATPSRALFLGRASSAHAQSPRICTFHSNFNFRSFSTCARHGANSFRFCTCKNGGVRYRYFKSQMRGFARFVSKPSARSLPPSLVPHRCLQFQSNPEKNQAFAHSSAKPQNPPSLFSITYALNFPHPLCSQAFAHSRGEGVSTPGKTEQSPCRGR